MQLLPSNPMIVEHLMLKSKPGLALESRTGLQLDPLTGIDGAQRTPPLRHLLLVERDSLRRLGLQPGDMRENIVLSCDGLYDLRSGTMLRIGTAELRLTFHCEPCARVTALASAKTLLHQRGYLASVTAAGTMRIGDAVEVLDTRQAPIPYAPRDRIAWYLQDRHAPIDAMELLWQVGLPRGYARALPALLRRIGGDAVGKVRFRSRQG
jgi:MOSC domain-containing protein YiiM